MRNIYILLLLLMFIIRKDACILGASSALVFWSKSLFPILFPTFILVDLLLSSELVKYITNIFGIIFKKIFKTSPLAAFIFFISMLCGTPTNAKILKKLHDEKIITSSDINKILSFTLLFNPFLIISFAGFKALLIIWISNLFTGFILRNSYITSDDNITYLPIKFSISESISTNITTIINILGTVTMFMCLSYALPFINPEFNIFVSSVLELSTALYKNKMYLNSTYLYLFMLSIGGISIFSQIKGILKDAQVDYKFILKSRIITTIISLIICWLT